MIRLVKKTFVVLAAGTLLGLLALTCSTLETQLRAQPTGEEKTTMAEQATAPAQQTSAGWREQNAYTLGVQAYIYCFPWVYMPEARWLRTEDMNHEADVFTHIRKLEDAKHLSGGAPNNDTLYSRAWVYLKDEPVILSVPEIKDRYYTMEIVDFMGDNFAYVGVRATGTKAGNYAIIGPGWKGQLPSGVTALPPSSTPWATILGRTLIKEDEELKVVFAIQDQYKLTPLSQWGKGETKPPANAVIWEPLSLKADPLADWKNANRAMLEVPPAASDAVLLHTFSLIGIGPGLDINAQDEATKKGLARAAIDGKKIIAGAFAGGYLQKQVNGWNYPPPATGRPTPTGDWLFRAVQMLAGFVANDPEEAMYINVSLDGEGKLLTGANRYVIHFPKGGQPKVNAFWSITMYNPEYNLVDNPINRYSLGDRSGMKENADGSLDIYLQKDSPGADKEANWLPAPAGNFFLIMRTYLPSKDLVDQTWQPPAIKVVK
jgi:hypothetical protein